MKGVIYTRVSSDEQVKGTSLEFQEGFCRKYCEQKGIEVAAVFQEEGETAKSLHLKNRKKFLDALDFCRKNKNHIQAFVVLRLDRFARNTEDHFAVRKVLLDCGTSVHSVSEPIGNKPSEKFIETVLAGAAEYENAIRKQRSIDGMASKINQGIYPWRPPMGYKSLHFNKKGEKKTEPDPPDECFPLIQKALKDFARGLYTQTELAKMLDKQGLKQIRGRTTTPQIIDRIVGKYLKFYAGIIINPWTGEEKEGLHKKMITKEELYQIQLIRSGKARQLAKYNKHNPDFPLRKTVLCGNCKKPLTGSAPRGNGGRYFYYHCRNKDCELYGKSIAKDIIETKFSKYLKRITPDDKFFKVLKESVMDLWQEKERDAIIEGQKHEKFLADLHKRRERIFEMREEGSYTKEEFLERKKEMEGKILEAEFALKEAQIENFDIENVITYMADFIRNLGDQWTSIPPDFWPWFQKLIFPEGIPYQNNSGFGTTKLGVIFNLNQAFLKAQFTKKSPLATLVQINWNQLMKELKLWREFQAAVLSNHEKLSSDK